MVYTKMLVYRIAKMKYLEDLTGTGARLYGGRWNHEGYEMLYTSENLSLAVLELLANQVRDLLDDTYGYIQIEIPDSNATLKFNPELLPTNWRNGIYAEETLQFGTNWLNQQSSLALQVPSAVLKQESNILINPNHPDAKTIRIATRGKLELDGRISSNS